MAWSSLKPLAWRLGFLLIVYTALRAAFLGMHHADFAAITAPDLALSFLHGLRFDAVAIATLSSLYIVLFLMPHGRWAGTRAERVVMTTAFALPNLPFVWLNMVDLAYYSFTGRRSTAQITTLGQDILQQGLQLAMQYWYLVLAGALIGIFIASVAARGPQGATYARRTSRIRRVASALLIVLATGVAVRGGLQLKPVTATHAYVLPTTQLGDLALNSTVTFLRSKGRGVPRSTAFASLAEARAVLDRPDPRDPEADAPRRALKAERRDNVVIIILESFGLEYTALGGTGTSYTPFLDELMTRGLAFSNHFANGRRSIEATTSILSGIPSLMDDPYITSLYKGNVMKGLPALLKPHGYRSLFFHGGQNGTMYFDVFARLAGFDSYYGLSEYPEPRRDFDGTWGIYDEPFLEFMAKTLTKTPEPFLASVFTLSSHNPYSIPDQYEGQFPKGTLPIHESIGYADHALRRFFEQAAAEPWYQHTLFVITADHTALTADPRFESELGRFRVPLVLFHPDMPEMKGIDRRAAQHADIVPTVIDHLGLSAESLPFGHSVLDRQWPGRAFNQVSDSWWYVGAGGVLHRGSDGALSSSDGHDLGLDLAQPDGTKPWDEARAARELEACIYFFRNGIIDDAWYGSRTERSAARP